MRWAISQFRWYQREFNFRPLWTKSFQGDHMAVEALVGRWSAGNTRGKTRSFVRGAAVAVRADSDPGPCLMESREQSSGRLVKGAGAILRGAAEPRTITASGVGGGAGLSGGAGRETGLPVVSEYRGERCAPS